VSVADWICQCPQTLSCVLHTLCSDAKVKLQLVHRPQGHVLHQLQHHPALNMTSSMQTSRRRSYTALRICKVLSLAVQSLFATLQHDAAEPHVPPHRQSGVRAAGACVRPLPRPAVAHAVRRHQAPVRNELLIGGVAFIPPPAVGGNCRMSGAYPACAPGGCQAVACCMRAVTLR
jgi:hypothetical protein